MSIESSASVRYLDKISNIFCIYKISKSECMFHRQICCFGRTARRENLLGKEDGLKGPEGGGGWVVFFKINGLAPCRECNYNYDD